MNKTKLLSFGLIIFLGCSVTEIPEEVEGSNPIYVTFAGHVEDSKMYTDCAVYEQKRTQLLDFAEAMKEKGVAFNFQASYEWFVGVQNCETEDLMNRLAEDYDFEIDVHQEGASEALDDVTSGNNMADIRYLAGELTDYVTETSGFQWDNPKQYKNFQYGQQGRLHDFEWHPELLVGGVSIDHTRGDFSRDMTSLGVWVPSNFTKKDFHTHDESEEGHMIYIGSGPNQFMNDWGEGDCHFTNSASFVSTLTDYVEEGKIYTYTVFVPQKIIFDEPEKLMTLLDEFIELQEQGYVEFAHFTEVAEIWEEDFNSEPNIFTYDQISPEDYTCE